MLDISKQYPWKLKHNEIITKTMKNNITKAYEICTRVLRDAYNQKGINAGQTHFSDVWIRDSCFAGWGALALNDTQIIQNFLLHCFEHMNENGQCPLRIGQKYFLLKYIGLKGPQGATYIEDKYVSIPMDSNALIIILFFKYLIKTKNNEFGSKYYFKIKKAIQWYETYKINHLIHEGPYAGWADSVKKKGHVLYTNALYYEALNCMKEISELLNIKSDITKFYEMKTNVKTAINDQFWNGEYLNDWIYKGASKTTFSIEGNMLAILFDVISKEKKDKIITHMLNQSIISEHGCPVVYKHYDWVDIYPPFLLINLRDYHNGLIWFWVSCIASVSLHENNYKKHSIELLNKMANKINRDNTVYEVYTKKGVPVNRLFYKSEEGFAWSAGLFVWAYQEVVDELMD